MVSRAGVGLLCDFGLSRVRHEVSRTNTTIVQGGRRRFVAPEISSGLKDRVDEKSDIYSLAVTIYALGTRLPPFKDILVEAAACKAVQGGARPKKCGSLGGLTMEETAYLWCLLERMWNHDPRRRPTASVARDEMIQTSRVCLKSAAAQITASSTSVNVQPSKPAISLDTTDAKTVRITVEAKWHSAVVGKAGTTLNACVCQTDFVSLFNFHRAYLTHQITM